MSRDELHGLFGPTKPCPVGSRRIECEERAAHEKSVAEVGTGGILFVMAKTAAGQGPMSDDPVRAADGIVKIILFSSDGVKCRQRVNGPTVFARVDMLIYPRDSTLSALSVA